MNKILDIKSATKIYDIYTEKTIDFINQYVSQENTFFVFDKMVYELYSTAFAKIPDSRLFLLVAKEEYKTIESALEICEQIITLESKRNTHLISFGGGIVQDVTGFVANVLYRGIGWTFVPTTLLAACDSCIGGKSSLNYKNYKNLLGTFFPPDKIILHMDFLKSLSRRDLLSGLGEVLKFNVIAGPKTLQNIESNLGKLIAGDTNKIENFIYSSLAFKKNYVEADEFDRGERIKLNFAHTFGHAIEVSSHYIIPHGTAVAMGIVVANTLSVERGLMSDTFAERIEALAYQIIEINNDASIVNPDELISAIRKDKKQVNSGIAAVLLDESYELHLFYDIQVDEIRNGFAHLENFLKYK